MKSAENKRLWKMRIAALLAAVIAAVTVLSLTSCGDKYPKSTEEELRVVMRVGDFEVPFELYRYFFMNYKVDMDGGDNSYWSGRDAGESFAEIDGLTRDSLLRLYAVFSLCVDHDIDYEGRDVKKTVEKAIENEIEVSFGGSKDEYLARLPEANMNHSVFSFLMTEFECESRLYDALVESGEIKNDPATVTAAILGGEFCCAKQVLIRNDPGDNVEDNRALAEQILSQAQVGVDFDELIAKYGEDTEMIVNPTGRYFTRGELIEEFEDAAFALEVGELSQVVESPVGFHIILRCEIDPDYVSVNLNDLGESYLTAKFWQIVDARADALTITETDVWRGLSMDDFAG